MKKVSFTEMKNGTKEDYQLLEKYEKDFERKTADRIIKYLAAPGIIGASVQKVVTARLSDIFAKFICGKKTNKKNISNIKLE